MLRDVALSRLLRLLLAVTSFLMTLAVGGVVVGRFVSCLCRDLSEVPAMIRLVRAVVFWADHRVKCRPHYVTRLTYMAFVIWVPIVVCVLECFK